LPESAEGLAGSRGSAGGLVAGWRGAGAGGGKRAGVGNGAGWQPRRPSQLAPSFDLEILQRRLQAL